jgi:TetR/AcrR family transcriptional repressor of nem operon
MTRTDTREKILDEAERLMGARGYSGFSYQDIARPLGIRNAAIHYHFPAKADLGLAVIERYRAILHAADEDFRAGRMSPREQFEGYIRFFTREACENRTLCPMGVLTSDYFNLPDSMIQAGKRLKEEVLAWLTRVLEQGREDGEFEFGGPARDRALLVMATLQGARQLTRMMGPRSITNIVDQIRDDLVVDTSSRAA